MDKNGELSTESPCTFCGHPSVVVVDKIPRCARHAEARNEQLPTSIVKVANELALGMERQIG